jgi:hypothetical protein
VLHLGKIWNCVVLLDEADVFLEQRGLEDLNRNALLTKRRIVQRQLDARLERLIEGTYPVGGQDQDSKILWGAWMCCRGRN